MSSSVLILDENEIGRALRRIAHEILEHNPRPENSLIAGIPQRGIALAERIAQLIGQIEGTSPKTGIVDISMHRDDLSLRSRLPSVQETKLPLQSGRPNLGSRRRRPVHGSNLPCRHGCD